MNLRLIFFNSVGRLRSGWRVLIFLFLFFATLFLLGTVLRVFYVLLVNLAPTTGPNPYFENLIYRFLSLVAALVAGYICTRSLDGLPWRALGVSLQQHWFRHLLIGSLLGVISLALATAIATAAGGLSFAVSSRSLLLAVAGTMIGTAVLFVVAAFAEEALFRGYPLQTLTRARLAWLGVLLTSIPFGAAHLRNPNVVAGFTFINTSLAGILFAIAYLRSRDLWFPLGIHWAWNWALGSLFGLPVSGLNLAPHPLLRGVDLGPAWLTGGDYGIEGGLACTLALLVSTVFVWRTRLVFPTEEMVILTSQEKPVEEKRLLSISPPPNGSPGPIDVSSRS